MKRQTLVDSLGLLLKVVVSEANAPERVLAAYALMELLEERPELLEKVEVLWVDSGYDGDKESSFGLVNDPSPCRSHTAYRARISSFAQALGSRKNIWVV